MLTPIAIHGIQYYPLLLKILDPPLQSAIGKSHSIGQFKSVKDIISIIIHLLLCFLLIFPLYYYNETNNLWLTWFVIGHYTIAITVMF